MNEVRFPYDALKTADLVIDAVYEGGRFGNVKDDPISPLTGVGNQGGFRYVGRREKPRLLVITTSMNEPDWPDRLDLETGLFTYYGDNRTPGAELHDTHRGGNQILRDLFDRAHGPPEKRREVPPVFVFRTAALSKKAGRYRDVRFIGLAVPGAAGVPVTEDLVAVWHHSGSQRFQNYKAIFTILNVPKVSRSWINDIHQGNSLSASAPPEWRKWVEGGQPTPLRSVSTIVYPSKEEQLPATRHDWAMLEAIYQRFKDDPYEFEACAEQIARMMLPNIGTTDLTRISRDGGRDVVGTYRIGPDEKNGITVEFALEAKCYARDNCVTVKDTARLISRLRHRQFGILVTTSYVASQALKEIREDQHPVLIISGRDIVETLKQKAGIGDRDAVAEWLEAKFKEPAPRSSM